MPANTFTPWMYNTPFGFSGGGAPVVAQGSPEPIFHDYLDAQRSMWRRTPDSEWPDGYLGTIVSRRDDRLLDNLKARQNQRSYQRGVHKGERVDPGDYFFPPEFNLKSGIARQMVSTERFRPVGEAPQHLAADGKMLPRGSESLMELIDPHRREQLGKLLPSWR